LLARHDVVYARPVPALPRRSGSNQAVVLLEGRNGERLGPVKLLAPDAESKAVLERLSRARIVRSNEISKPSLLDAWSRTSLLYVAAHLVRDLQAPMLSYFPMTFAAGPDSLDESSLDVRDIRSTDLSACELAVLSSCASGEPYVVGGQSGPSMADAFLDAGARTVIHTRWQVRDDRAAVVAPSLAKAWMNNPADPIGACCAWRRSQLRNGRNWAHPFEWASWSISVRLPVQAWHGVDRPIIAAGSRRAPVGRAGEVPNGLNAGLPARDRSLPDHSRVARTTTGPGPTRP